MRLEVEEISELTKEKAYEVLLDKMDLEQESE